MKVIIIGPYPPPYGGISVHVKRMKHYLEKRKTDVSIYNESKVYKNVAGKIYSIKSYKKFIFQIPFLKADVIHFHSIDIRIRILLGFFKILGKKIILTIHGESSYEQLTNSNKFVQHLLLSSLKKIDKIICVSPKAINDLSCYGINRANLILIPAYINPIEEENDFSKIPKEVWFFVNDSEFLISANGCVRFNKGGDLYGIDILIKLIYNLKNIGKYVKLIITLLGVDEQNDDEHKYYNELKEKVIELKLQNDIYIYEARDTEFYPILKKSQIFIRPTNTDGDSVSIREALHYRIPVIASNSVLRPEAAILFKNRDIDDLYNKTVDVIENFEEYKAKLEDVIIEDNAEKIFEIYKCML